MHPLLRTVFLLAMVLMAAQAVAGTVLGETGADVSQAWCGAGGDVSVHPFVFPYGLQGRVDVSSRVAAVPVCAHAAFDGADFGLSLPPL